MDVAKSSEVLLRKQFFCLGCSVEKESAIYAWEGETERMSFKTKESIANLTVFLFVYQVNGTFYASFLW